MSNTVQKILYLNHCVHFVDFEITAFLFVPVKEYNLIDLHTIVCCFIEVIISNNKKKSNIHYPVIN